MNDVLDWTGCITYVVFLPVSASPQSNHEKTSHKPKLRDVLQNNWPVTLQKCQGQERPGKTQEMSQLSQGGILDWMLEQKKDSNGKTGEIQINCVIELIVSYQS